MSAPLVDVPPVVALVAWFIMTRSVFGYQMKVVGAAPHAARYGGFSENKTIWLAMLVSGGLAGMALLRIGRLSVTPVTPKEWKVIQEMGR